MADFSNLENLLLHREFIINDIYSTFPLSECFFSIPSEEYKNSTIDELSLAIYNNMDYYWAIIFFNPEVDISSFGIKNYANSGEFVKNKLFDVYITKLNKTSYTAEQIGKVFDMYNEYDTRTIVLPKKEYIAQIEKYINTAYGKLANG